MTNSSDILDDAAVWLCPVCASANSPEVNACRVCRADPAQGRNPQRAHEDTPHLSKLWKVVPLTAGILSTGLFFSSISPATTPWAEVGSAHGRQAEAPTSRHQAIKMTATDLKALAKELLSTSIHGDPPPTSIVSRIAYLRGRWKMYGDPDRIPGLEAAAEDLSRAFDDLSSASFLASNNQGDPHVADVVAEIITRIERIQETLNNVH